MDVGTVYHIFNPKNGKAYVGQTWGTLEKRWEGHCHPRSPCRALRNAIKKYGPATFIRTVLTNVSNQEDLDNAETYWIKFFETVVPNGYNLNEGGKGKRPSEETRQKLSEVWKGRKRGTQSPEHRRKVSEGKKGFAPWNKGKTLSIELRAKLSEAHKGYKTSEETKKKQSLAKLGKKKSPETRARMRLAARKRVEDAKARRAVSRVSENFPVESGSDRDRKD